MDWRIEASSGSGSGSGSESGSKLKFAAVQDVHAVCGALRAEESAKAKKILDRIVAMLTKLARRGYAVHEQ